MASIRQERIERMLLKEISNIFLKHRDGLLGGVFTTITKVKVSPDLSIAKVYVSVMDIEHKQIYIDELNQYQKQIRGILSKGIGKHLRRTPLLVFYLDDSLDYYDNIDKLLKGI